MADELKRELTLERVLNAPRDMVFRAWTDTKLLEQWWGPFGVTIPTCVWEAKPGGKINIVMLAGKELGEFSGKEWPMTGEVQEVVSPEKLVYVSNAIMDGKPIMETLTTVTLEEQGDKTKMTLHIVVTKTTPEAAGPLSNMEMGWNQQLDKMVTFVEKL